MKRAWPEWSVRLLLVVVSPLLFLLLLEGAAWLAGVEPHAAHGTALERNAILRCRFSPKPLRICEPERLAEATRTQVLVLGGSSVVGHPAGERRTISHFMTQRLEAEAPGVFRVRNLGRACKDSIFVRACAERALGAKPGALVVYTGHNDFAGFTSRRPELLMWFERSAWWLIPLHEWLCKTRGFSLLSRNADLPLMWAHDPAAALDADDRARAHRVILGDYGENLEAILEAARAGGVRVVWATLVANLYECPVRREGWDGVVTRAREAGAGADPWLKAYSEAIDLYRAGSYAAALERFAAARDAEPLGRAPSMLNQRIRELGRERADLDVVDVEAELARVGTREGIGCNFFGTDRYCDGVHPNPRTNRIIGELFADRLLELHRRGAL